jgi:hypothetical protein
MGYSVLLQADEFYERVPLLNTFLTLADFLKLIMESMPPEVTLILIP